MNTIHRFGALLLSAISVLLLAAPRAQAAAGDLDTLNTDIDGRVYATAVQPDGKILVAGSFLFPGGQERYGIARLNANGTLDTSFNANLDITSVEVNCVAVQPDGKILIAGNFNRSAGGSGSGHSDIMRLNADGSVDGIWTPLGTLFRVYCVAVQPDGKILIGGTITQVNFVGGLIDRNYVARFEANGAADTSFNANIGAIFAGDVRSVAVQADGRILIGGNFSTVGGVTRQGFARLEANGALDASFDANLNSTVNCVVLQPNGKILIGGLFSSAGGVSRGRVARLEPNGALDGAFDPNANQNVNSIALQADGKVLLGGIFTTFQPNGAGAAITRNRIARVNADGTLDLAFDPNANNAVYSVALQGDGMVLVGGNFTSLQPNGAGAPTTRNRLARLLNDPATQTLNAPDTAHITWVRGGTVPEVSRVTFEVSTDGGATWGAPIAPVRGGVLSNWRVDGGIALPASGLLRARGDTLGGYYSASSGRIEQVLSFSGITANAPEITVTGNGAVIPDGDTTPGLPDGTEFHAAFGASTAVRTFTITNTGTAALNLTGTPKVVVSGTHAADFAVTLQPASPLAATNGTTTFQVTFTPGAVGVRNATLTFANDDANEASFDFAVTGRGLSFTQDTDGDGLNDASELLGAALGFNWQAGQPALVQTYNGIANGAGLYTTAQVQALHMDVPLIQRNPGTNTFTFTFGLRKSTTLAPGSFVPFPFTPAGTSVNGAGKVQYQFTAPDNAAFFRLEMP